MNIKAVVKKFVPEKKLKKIRTIIYERNPVLDIRAVLYMQAVDRRQVRNKDVIRVAFIVQMAEMWGTESPIYDAMRENPRFEPELIVIPAYDWINQQVEIKYEDNYFLQNYPEAIRAYDKDRWINLAEKKYDYVFFQRPYDIYLPKGFKSTDIVKFSKVCYIPYGYAGSDIFDAKNTEKRFFRNARLSFLESGYKADLLRKKYFFPAEKKQHKVMNKGYPALVPYFSFPAASGIKRVMWTPRWAFYRPSGVGTNFLKYKDTFLDIADRFPQYEFVFRPHPHMFGEMRKRQLMTEGEIDQFMAELKSRNIVYDRNTPVYESLKGTDLLITDYSSIIIQYFLTGRPIIYCESTIKFNDSFQVMKKGLYSVKSEGDLKTAVADILGGHDPLKGCRETIINTEFDMHKNAVENILGEIIKDHEGE